jgi:hypothetical protein
MFECDDDVIVVELGSGDSNDLKIGAKGFVVEAGSNPTIWIEDIQERAFMWDWQLKKQNWR